MKYGRGRVVAFTDSTVFSSFCIFTDGYQTFTLGAMEYLNRINTYASLNFFFIIVALVSGILILWLFWNDKKTKVLWAMLLAGGLAFSMSLPFFSYLTDISYPLPTEKTVLTHVSFEQQHSSFQISVKPTAVLESTSNNYGTFYVWTQRIGCVPSIENTLRDAVRHGDITVIINPSTTFTEEDVQLATSYLEQGGRILLMDSITNKKSTANELIGAFGIWITTTTETQQLFENNTNLSKNFSKGSLSTPILSLTGGTQLLVNAKNSTKVSVVDFVNSTTGALGRLVVLIDSYSFCDTVMGGTFTEPTEEQKGIYDTEFFLFNTSLKP